MRRRRLLVPDVIERQGRMVVVAALVLLIPVSASPDLIKQMEFEIKVREIIEEVYEASLKAASVAVKKTSLYARYRKARDKADRANDKYGEEVTDTKRRRALSLSAK